MRILFFFTFAFVCMSENGAISSKSFQEKNINLYNFEISEANDQVIICKIHTKYASTDVASAKNMAIKNSLIESIKKTATEVFFQNNSEYTNNMTASEFDPMLKAIKSFKIENENMYQDNVYEADFIITIDKKILSMNSFELLQKYLKNSDTKNRDTLPKITQNKLETKDHDEINNSNFTINSNSICVVYRNKNAISKWLYDIKNKLDKNNIKYNLKEISANELKIEITSDNMQDTIKHIESIGFSVTKENDTLILTEIGI